MSQSQADDICCIRCSFSVYCPDIICKPSYGRCPHVGLIFLRDTDRNVKDHLRSLKLSVGGDEATGFKSADHDIYSEADLICRRAGLFITDLSLTVCPTHRSKLGLDFRQRTGCCYPDHKGKGKSFRGISAKQSQYMLSRYGELIPVGSGICYGCYRVLSKDSISIVSDQSQQVEETALEEEEEDFSTSTRKDTRQSCLKPVPVNYTNQQTDYISDEEMLSNSQTSSQISSWSQENVDVDLSDLNSVIQILGRGHVSPIKFRLKKELESLQPSTLRCVKRKATEAVDLLLNAIAPGQSEKLLKLIGVRETESPPSLLNDLLVNLYIESTDTSMKKQLLSMIANSYTKSQLQQMIPGVTVHAIDEARKHSSKFGAGASVPKKEPMKRQKMDKEKLDHALDFFFDPTFHQVTAFGTKNMKLSTGLSITIPNVIRTAYHSTLVDTYLSFCKEAHFEPLSKASLFKILSECPASRRTNLKGLDNIAADGNSAFDTLIGIVEEIEKSNITQNMELKECNERLQSSKLYIKTEYKLHIQKENACADHCISYALSDGTNSQLNQKCNHEHEMQCQRCNDFSEAVTKLKSLVSGNNDLSAEKKEEIFHDIDAAEKNVNDWKSHIVRAVAQDSCRLELLENLKEGEVVMIMDWAMKFLPLMYREKQSDWFAQKGFNWHVIVCVFKDDEDKLRHRTYVHIIDTAKQDWYSVACLLQHVLMTLKTQLPEVMTAFVRSDNAGCYHCSNLWCSLPEISENTGISIKRYDFSESQNGKSYCDAKIAHMRGKLRKFVKSGGNITSAADMKMALDSGNGVPGCQVAHVEIQQSNQVVISHKIKGITKISNVQFESVSAIIYWRNYNVGQGQKLLIVPIKFESTLVIISDFKPPLQLYGTINQHVSLVQQQQPADDPEIALHCPEPECSVVLNSYSDMNDHCFLGKHHYHLSTYDGIRMKWKDTCLEIASTSNKSTNSTLTSGENVLKKGWALKKDRKNTRFSDNIKGFLKAVFDEGERSGNKANPASVARNMRMCCDNNGHKRFKASEFLHPSQISSYFSRLAAQAHNPDVVDDDIDSAISLINKVEALQELDILL